jgi:hypothetical protein
MKFDRDIVHNLASSISIHHDSYTIAERHGQASRHKGNVSRALYALHSTRVPRTKSALLSDSL